MCGPKLTALRVATSWAHMLAWMCCGLPPSVSDTLVAVKWFTLNWEALGCG